jgi:hypothetical protein
MPLPSYSGFFRLFQDQSTDVSVINDGVNATATSDTTSSYQYKELKGDLFSCPSDVCLAHCVSVDLHMGKGIAVLFKKKFGHVNQLREQSKYTSLQTDRTEYLFSRKFLT